MAADNSDKDQKTELPTAKRRADAARDGDVLLSREMATALSMLAGAAWLWLAGGWFVESQMELVRHGLQLGVRDHADFDPARNAGRLATGIALPLISLFAVTLIAAVAGPAITGSFGWRSKSMAFKANKLNPLTGLKRMFGMHAAIELAKALAKVLALGALGYWVIAHELPSIMALAAVDIHAAALRSGQSLVMAVLVLALGLLLIGAIDLPAQIFQRNKRLMMTRQDVKDEMRESEGAPELKAAQRERAQAILSGSARKAVSEASVILTNPTHFAVALRYRPGHDFAPVVVARGRGEVALAIRTLAKEQAVPCLEYPQLTRAIYFTSRAGKTVAEDLYVAVAAVLAFVFQIERALEEGWAPPRVDVPDGKRFDENGRPTG